MSNQKSNNAKDKIQILSDQITLDQDGNLVIDNEEFKTYVESIRQLDNIDEHGSVSVGFVARQTT